MNDEPNVQKAFDERIDWINQVTDLARKPDLKAVWQAIVDTDDEHLRSVIFVLIVGRAEDQDRLAEMLARLN